MASASPTCLVKIGAGSFVSTTNGVDLTPGAAITIALANTAGADFWSITCIGTDETSTAPTLTVDSTLKQATFTAPAAGKAFLFQSTVRTNGSPDSYSTKFMLYTLTAGGARVAALNETTEGGVFGWLGRVNGAVRSGGPALSSWSNAYELDFSTLSTQAITGNGAQVISGKTWTMANFGNATTATITNGSGLILAPNATNSSYQDANRTAPILSIPVSSLVSGFDLTAHEIRVSAYISAINGDANTELALVGFECGSAPSSLNVSVAKGFGAGAVTIRTLFGVASVSTLVDDATNNSDTVVILSFNPRGLRANVRSGVYSSGWPATTRGRRFASLGGAVADPFGSATDLNLFLAAQSGNTSGNFSVTFRAIKVEALYT